MWTPNTLGGRVRRLAAVAAAVAATFVVAPAGWAVATDSATCGAGPCITSIRAADVAPGAQVPQAPQVSHDAPVAPVTRAPGLRPAVRIKAPVTAASAGPLVGPTNSSSNSSSKGSSCRRDLVRSAMTIDIPDIAYSCPVYGGGQATMDSGAVVHLTDPASGGLLAEHPGQRGTLWIAAHRSTHGGAFEHVPDLADGAVVVVADGTRTASYRIVGRVLVHVQDDLVVDPQGRATNTATVAAITRADGGGGLAPRLLLQTCEGPTMRWMIYGDLVTA